MILIVQFGAVLALPEEYLPTSGVKLGILSDIVDTPIQDGPAIVIAGVLCYLILRIEDVVGVCHQGGLHSRLHHELALGHPVLHRDLCPRYVCHRLLLSFVYAVFVTSLRELIDIE